MARRDEAEFVAFADAYSPQLRRTAYLLCGDWHLSADLTQEALIRLYVAWPRLDQGGGLHAYARRTVTNLAIDHRRKRGNQEQPVERFEDVAAAPGVPGDDLLLAALAALPPRQRACVVLRYYEDLAVDDVAAALGCQPGTVKSQTARGLDRLRQLYRDRSEELAVDDEDVSAEVRTW